MQTADSDRFGTGYVYICDMVLHICDMAFELRVSGMLVCVPEQFHFPNILKVWYHVGKLDAFWMMSVVHVQDIGSRV